MTPILTTEKLAVTYPNGTRALTGVDLSIGESGCFVILGKSGAGKSTLLRCINQLVRPTSGQIHLRGKDITHVSGSSLRQVRRQVGMVFQQFNLIPRLNVLQNVLVGRLKDQRGLWNLLSHGRQFSKEEEELAFECLKQVHIESTAFQRASTLSGGQQQRVAIARTLAQGPEVILADEPIASLDPESSSQVMDILKRISIDKKIPVIVNLHQVEIAKEYADHMIGMAAGKIAFNRRPDQITDHDIENIYRMEPQ